MSNHQLLKKIYAEGGIPPRGPYAISDNEIDLVLAYFNGEVDVKDLVIAYSASGSNPAVYRAARIYRELCMDGDLVRSVDRRKETTHCPMCGQLKEKYREKEKNDDHGISTTAKTEGT